MKKVPQRFLRSEGPVPVRCSTTGFRSQTFSLQDFIPILANAYAVKRLKTCLRGTRFGAPRYIREISAKMPLSQPIAYDKTLIHEKTKVIGLQ